MEIINTVGVNVPNFISGQNGKFRAIVKSRAGFMTVVDIKDHQFVSKDPVSVLRTYKPKALQTVEFLPEGGSHWLTVFARTGKKVQVIDRDFVEGMTVGDINVYFTNTNIHSQDQYQAVGARTWADKAFTTNIAA